MPYYTGDNYYQGDNYAAGGILGDIGKAIVGGVKGFIGGGPIGALKGAAGALITRGGGASITPIIAPGALIPGGQVVPTPGLGGFVQRMLPGGKTGYEVMGRKRRRLNPLNIKALRRAMRRAKGFEKQARRVGSFFSPGKTYRLKGRRARAK